MQITKELIESLLWEEEGSALDFKREQYPLAAASVEQKSELLKDILAFTNAFGRADAFIMVGVEEVKGGRSRVIGVKEQLEDAHVQQFVNAKVQRPIQFSYRAAEHNGLPIGIIHIPRQRRPVYSTRNFGKVRENIVYIRRGSSTDVATPDEIAQMGADQFMGSVVEPRLEVQLGDRSTGRLIGTELSISSRFLNIPQRASIPHFERGPSPMPSLGHANPDYYRELAHFTQVTQMVRPLALVLRNSGEVTAHDARLVMRITDYDRLLYLVDENDMPRVPERMRDLIRSYMSSNVPIKQDVLVSRVGDTWKVEGWFRKVQPQATAWLTDNVYIGAQRSCELPLEIQVFADNLSRPMVGQLKVTFQVQTCDVDLKEIQRIERDRYSNSPEGKEMLRQAAERRHADAPK